MANIVMFVILIVIFYNKFHYCWNADCIHGEKWHSNCESCTCADGKAVCEQSHCIDNSLREFCGINGIYWLEKDERCHCFWENEVQTTVCVSSQYQNAMHGAPCSRHHFSYVYDANTYCECSRNNRTVCKQRPIANIDAFCLNNEIITEGCFKCKCSMTKFKICRFNSDCKKRRAKAGACPKPQRLYAAEKAPLLNKIMCFYTKLQRCYNDYHCPGVQKCCIYVCESVCVDPVSSDN